MWGFLALVVGLLYGWLKPGAQDKAKLLVNGLLIGLLVGLALALLGFTIGSRPMFFGFGLLGAILSVVVISLLFVLGVWIGDLIENHQTRRQPT